eukprot:SAG31_NODE_4228_length_3442_cov_2.372719_4_plen_105_part_00
MDGRPANHCVDRATGRETGVLDVWHGAVNVANAHSGKQRIDAWSNASRDIFWTAQRIRQAELPYAVDGRGELVSHRARVHGHVRCSAVACAATSQQRFDDDTGR